MHLKGFAVVCMRLVYVCSECQLGFGLHVVVPWFCRYLFRSFWFHLFACTFNLLVLSSFVCMLTYNTFAWGAFRFYFRVQFMLHELYCICWHSFLFISFFYSFVYVCIRFRFMYLFSGFSFWIFQCMLHAMTFCVCPMFLGLCGFSAWKKLALIVASRLADVIFPCDIIFKLDLSIYLYVWCVSNLFACLFVCLVFVLN